MTVEEVATLHPILGDAVTGGTHHLANVNIWTAENSEHTPYEQLLLKLPWQLHNLHISTTELILDHLRHRDPGTIWVTGTAQHSGRSQKNKKKRGQKNCSHACTDVSAQELRTSIRIYSLCVSSPTHLSPPFILGWGARAWTGVASYKASCFFFFTRKTLSIEGHVFPNTLC